MKKVYRLQNLDCAHCAGKMEKGIRKLSGVISAEVNFLSQKFVLEAEEADFADVYEEAVKVIHKYEPDVVVKKA